MQVQALSSSQAYIYEERDRLLQLQAECDDLRAQEADDSRRIEQLLRLLDAQHKAAAEGGSAKGRAAVLAISAEAGMRTSEAGAAEVDALKMRIESLQAQLVDQVTHYSHVGNYAQQVGVGLSPGTI